jgi:hypothetical protein
MSCYLCGNDSREQRHVMVTDMMHPVRQVRLVLCSSCFDVVMSGGQWKCWHELKP